MTASKITMRRKMTVVMLAALLFFAAVIIKLFVLQFIQGEELQQKAELMRNLFGDERHVRMEKPERLPEDVAQHRD